MIVSQSIPTDSPWKFVTIAGLALLIGFPSVSVYLVIAAMRSSTEAQLAQEQRRAELAIAQDSLDEWQQFNELADGHDVDLATRLLVHQGYTEAIRSLDAARHEARRAETKVAEAQSLLILMRWLGTAAGAIGALAVVVGFRGWIREYREDRTLVHSHIAHLSKQASCG